MSVKPFRPRNYWPRWSGPCRPLLELRWIACERALLGAALLLLMLGYLSAAAVYFLQPRDWLMPVEIWIYRLPGILQAKWVGVIVVAAAWLLGVVLLCWRGTLQQRVPWTELGLAAASPLFMILSNKIFIWIARHIAPLSL